MTSPDAVLLTATSATRQGALDEADRLAREALGGFRLRVDDDGRMRALNLLGAIAFERGETAAAAERFARALEIARSLGDHLLGARALNNLASVTHLRGEVEAALALYREALLTYQRLGDRRGSAETWQHCLGVPGGRPGLLTDPRTTPAEALEWLGSWIGVSFDPAYPKDRRRQLIASAPELYRKRGTL